MTELPRVFLVIPRYCMESPVLGTAALCNALVDVTDVSLVTLKPAASVGPFFSERVNRVDLSAYPGWYAKLRAYRAHLSEAAAKGRRPVSISLAFSGDLFNLMSGSTAVRIASLRNNPFMDYRFLFGRRGTIAAHLHVQALKRFDCVFSMSKSMDQLLADSGVKRVRRVGNFIDEARFERPSAPAPLAGRQIRLLCMGVLIARKRWDRAIRCVHELRAAGHDVVLDMVGAGPLMEQLRSLAREKGLTDEIVRFHGFRNDREVLLEQADVLLLPSESEGISRSVMEALYWGVPCVLRDVEAAGEIITDGVNGALFSSETDITAATLRAIAVRQASRAPNVSLLPDAFRQATCVAQVVDAIRQLSR